MRHKVFSRYIQALLAGDPVALSATGILFLLILPVLIVWARVAISDRREQRAKRERLARIGRVGGTKVRVGR